MKEFKKASNEIKRELEEGQKEGMDTNSNSEEKTQKEQQN
jgi:Sec-independent protein translocase protein TatA